MTDKSNIKVPIKEFSNNIKSVDFWDTLPQEQKDDILLGIKDIENGYVVDYEDFMSKYR